MNQEIELKLALPRRALAAVRRHPLVAGAEKLGNAATLDNTYYDTPELQLKARKVAVRTRRQGRNWLQTVKCAAVSNGGLSQRPEWEQPYTGSFDFSQVDAPEAAKLLNRHAAALVPVFTTRFRRETRRLCPREGVSILLMIDSGEVQVTTPEGIERKAPICELELELEQGRAEDLFALACELAQTLPLMPADLSKAERGYRLFLGTPSGAARAEASDLHPGDNVVDAFRSLAFACARQWQANAAAALAAAESAATPAERADAVHPDFIHQLRVAQRRLRALLKLFAPALPAEFAGQWNARLRDNAKRFGDARDLDVFHAELLAPVAPEGLADEASMARLLQVTTQAREAARHAAVQALDMATQGRLLLELGSALLQLPSNSLVAAADLRTFARLRLARLRKRARRRFEAAATLEAPRLHMLRIAFKQLRYGIEFFAPLFPARTVARYQEGLVKALASLGFLQDVDIARGRMLAWADEDAALQPAAAFVLGWHAPHYARLRRRILQDCDPLLWGKTPW
ncbi:CYTH and CHAD domain-containing protein [Thauera linaloolentis]|uniref:CHAD domain containing protein n=1 Tax=Thauera linaloolentis (strain DSM 12138 / JCM 21573 / CCUG 41526 / CIP 105981 / IAM 15112 / NBRC 102519 / 47Lol) TaxID=1123367 RepID=N6Y0Q6_THAL4|nr:CYTH and CHAD domain-containing protein [Thauera linaloolentis]ENO87731.1 CHAD domain containing protein [Thauera linaloolentis 47Lol = DSM 12138]MCM8567597.1 CYTH and CHAD domain-containing protein [Thauera linaloolentis]